MSTTKQHIHGCKIFITGNHYQTQLMRLDQVLNVFFRRSFRWRLVFDLAHGLVF